MEIFDQPVALAAIVIVELVVLVRLFARPKDDRLAVPDRHTRSWLQHKPQ